jgi:hypothetical protein
MSDVVVVSGAAGALGTSTSRGAVSSSRVTSTWSPAFTPAPSRTSRFRPTMNPPPIRATLVRQV